VEETIVAPATPAGRGGISIIRISGKSAKEVGLSLCGELPKSWSFKPCSILDGSGVLIDSGLVVFFGAPKSYTGEDVVLSGEILCPASEEAGKRTTCDKCGLCAGLTRKAKDIMIPVHGSKAIKANKTNSIADFTGAEMAGIA